MSDFDEESYDVGQYCVQGHEINRRARTQPEHNQKFCAICGSATVTKCGHCGTDIRGSFNSRFLYSSSTVRPNHCHECGNAYPWVAEALRASADLIDAIDDLSDKDKANLKRSIEDIVADGQRVQVGVTMLKKLLGRSKDVAKEAIWKFTVEVASETAKKALLGS